MRLLCLTAHILNGHTSSAEIHDTTKIKEMPAQESQYFDLICHTKRGVALTGSSGRAPGRGRVLGVPGVSTEPSSPPEGCRPLRSQAGEAAPRPVSRAPTLFA